MVGYTVNLLEGVKRKADFSLVRAPCPTLRLNLRFTLEKHLKYIIYYRKSKTANRAVTNKNNAIRFNLSITSIVYQFQCPVQKCVSCHESIIYIGYTNTPLIRSPAYQLPDKSTIKRHLNYHNLQASLRKILVCNVRFLYRSPYRKHLNVREALYIKLLTHSNNLRLFNSRNGALKFVLKKDVNLNSSIDQHARLGIEPASIKTAQNY